MNKNINELSEFKKKGIQIFSKIYSDQEIDEIEKILIKSFKKVKSTTPLSASKNFSNCSFTVPELNKLLFNEKLIDAMKLCLGSDELMYTSVLGIQKDMQGSWHKDDGTGSFDKGYFLKDPYNDETCKVLRVGIYLQDHNKHNLGTAYKPFSHKYKELEWGETKFVECKRGDISIFDVRLTHSGAFRHKLYLKVINFLPDKFKPIIDISYNIFRNIYLYITNKSKVTIWMSFGIPNSNTINYSKNIMKAQLVQSGGNWYLPKECEELLASKGIDCASKYFENEDFQQ